MFVQPHPECAVSGNDIDYLNLTRSYHVITRMMMHQLELESLQSVLESFIGVQPDCGVRQFPSDGCISWRSS